MTFDHKPIYFKYDDLKTEESAGSRKYITPDGFKMPSVTTVLGAKTKQAIIEWRKRVGEEEANRIARHAATRGSGVHNIAERYIRNEREPVKKGTMPHVLHLWKTLKGVIDEHVGDVYAIEQPLYSDTLLVAGRVDLIAEFDGELSIIDFKTSKRRKSRDEIHSYFMQECAYACMFEEQTEIPVNQLVTIMLVDDDPEPLIFIEKTKDWIDPLISEITDYYKNL